MTSATLDAKHASKPVVFREEQRARQLLRAEEAPCILSMLDERHELSRSANYHAG